MFLFMCIEIMEAQEVPALKEQIGQLALEVAALTQENQELKTCASRLSSFSLASRYIHVVCFDNFHSCVCFLMNLLTFFIARIYTSRVVPVIAQPEKCFRISSSVICVTQARCAG